jgi:hypothetical protein
MSEQLTHFDSIVGCNLKEIRGKHRTYFVPFSKIKDVIHKWSGNREPSPKRIEEMNEYYKQGGHIPFTLHLAILPDEGIVCYDGLHRLQVLKIIDDDRICDIDVLVDATQDEVLECFQNLNKSVQVSDVYIDTHHSVRDEILAYKKRFIQRYKPFASGSKTCQRPNFCESEFEQHIYRVYEEFGGNVSITTIIQYLEELNEGYKNGTIKQGGNKKLPPRARTKCETKGLWLFAYSKEINIEHVRQIHSRYNHDISLIDFDI